MKRGIELDGAVAVVTGASSGIGRATAKRFATKGSAVVLASRDETSLAEATEECRSVGGRAVAVPTDVPNIASVEQLARRAVAEFGRIDIWVNNAGVMAFGAIGEVPAAVQHQIIETNLLGAMHGARAALPTLREEGRGVIVNVASLYGKMTSPYVSAYATSKFGLLGSSQVLRQELKGEPGLHVCTVLPGSMDTPTFRHAANYTGRAVKPPPPVGRPQRVARAVVLGAERPRRRRTVGRLQQAASWVHALMPSAYSDVDPLVMERVSLDKERVPRREGNVFATIPETNTVHGGWRSPWRRPATAGLGILALAAVSGAGWRHRRSR